MTTTTNPMEFTQYKRNAMVGEWVYVYRTGDRNDNPVMGMVVTVNDTAALIATIGERQSRWTPASTWLWHIDDPRFEGRPQKRAKEGAWDFHPVYGLHFNRYVTALKASHVRKEQLQAQKESTDPALFEALEALERHGASISLIAEDTGRTVDQLKAMPEFHEAFRKAKAQEWQDKQDARLAKQQEQREKAEQKKKEKAEAAA